jgi:hypothetical protein
VGTSAEAKENELLLLDAQLDGGVYDRVFHFAESCDMAMLCINPRSDTGIVEQRKDNPLFQLLVALNVAGIQRAVVVSTEPLQALHKTSISITLKACGFQKERCAFTLNEPSAVLDACFGLTYMPAPKRAASNAAVPLRAVNVSLNNVMFERLDRFATLRLYCAGVVCTAVVTAFPTVHTRQHSVTNADSICRGETGAATLQLRGLSGEFSVRLAIDGNPLVCLYNPQFGVISSGRINGEVLLPDEESDATRFTIDNDAD